MGVAANVLSVAQRTDHKESRATSYESVTNATVQLTDSCSARNSAPSGFTGFLFPGAEDRPNGESSDPRLRLHSEPASGLDELEVDAMRVFRLDTAFDELRPAI